MYFFLFGEIFDYFDAVFCLHVIAPTPSTMDYIGMIKLLF